MSIEIERVFDPEPSPPIVIAEVGSNHCRDWAMTLRLLDAAATARVEAVKFQTYSGNTLYSTKTETAPYLIEQGLIKEGETVVDLIDRISLPREWQARLDEACRERGLAFLSTPFDLQAVEELEAVGVPAYKVASTEITHIPLLEAVGQTRKPVILSTGMSSLGDIESALHAIGHDRVILLQCTTAYPAKPQDANLRVIETLGRAFELPVGLSDHTRSSVAAAVAVALGARLLEKHITLDRSLPGPDHRFAIEPDELCEYAATAREAFDSLGSGRKLPIAAEEKYRRYRCGVFGVVDLPEGTILTREHLIVKRKPGVGGLDAADLPKLIGRRMRRSRAADEVLEWADV